MTDSTLAYQAQLYYREIGETNYIKVAQTKDLSSPNPEVGDVGITNNDSPNNTKEYRPGMIEGGDVEFATIYNKADCADMYALLGDGNIYEWALKYNDGAGWTWKGYLKGYGVEGETEDGILEATATMKVTSKPAFVETLSITTGS